MVDKYCGECGAELVPMFLPGSWCCPNEDNHGEDDDTLYITARGTGSLTVSHDDLPVPIKPYFGDDPDCGVWYDSDTGFYFDPDGDGSWRFIVDGTDVTDEFVSDDD